MTVEGVTYTVQGVTATVTRRGLMRDFTTAELAKFETMLCQWEGRPNPSRQVGSLEEMVDRVFKLLCELGDPVAGSQIEKDRNRDLYGPRQRISDGAIVTVIVDKNPMREGKRSHEQFAMVMELSGRTMSEIVALFAERHPEWPANLAISTVKWCRDKGYLEIREPQVSHG